MAGLPTRSTLLRWGAVRTLAGLRRGRQSGVLLGAAALFAGALRHTPRRRVLYRRRLRPGAAVVIRNGVGTTSRLEIRRQRDG